MSVANELSATPTQPTVLSGLARWWRMGWFVLLAVTLCLYLLRQVYDGPFGKDFTIFLTGAQVLANGDASSLYDLGVQAEVQRTLAGGYTFPGGVLPFNYPAYVAFFFFPTTFLTPEVSYYLWLAVNCVLFIGLVIWIVRTFAEWGIGGAPSILPLALLSFQPALEALLMGQMSIVTAALWWWALVSWRRERWGQVGVAVALSAFKPQMAALLVVALVAQRRWRVLGYVIGVQAAFWMIAVLIGGPQIFLGYIEMLRVSASTVGTLGFNPAAMLNLRGLLTVVGLPEGIVTVVALGGWLVSLGFTLLLWTRNLPLTVKFGLTALMAVILSPHLYMHDASLLLIVVVCAALSASTSEAATKRLNLLFLPVALITVSIYLIIFQITGSYVPLILSTFLLAGFLVSQLIRGDGGTIVGSR